MYIIIIIVIDLTAADSWLQVNAFTASQGEGKMTVQEVAMGFIRVANETMCRPIRALTQVLGILFHSLISAMRTIVLSRL